MPFVTLSLQSASVRRWHLRWRLRECHVVTLSSRTQGRKQCAINTSQSAVLCFQDIHMETFYLVLNWTQGSVNGRKTDMVRGHNLHTLVLAIKRAIRPSNSKLELQIQSIIARKMLIQLQH